MKKTFLLLVTIAIAKINYAQTPNWGWAETQTGGGCYTQAQQILASPRGSIYVSGRYGGTMTLGGITPAAAVGSGQVFSGKMDNSGNFLWIVPHTASGGTDYNYGFARDNKDNTYCTGVIGGGFYIDKYDSNGNKKWYNSNGNAAGYDIKTDDTDNVYVTGEYTGSFTLGTITLNSIAGSTDMFLAKFDSNGICKWLVSGGGSGYDGGRSVALDPDNNIYVCGSYSNDGTFGTVVAPTVTNGFPNLFIVKYNSSGTALRVSTATNAGFDTNYQFWRWQEVTVDSCGNAYVTGVFVNTANFGSLSVISSGVHNIFVAKCHFDGNWEWVQAATGVGDYSALGITLDKADDVYATGSFYNTAQFGGFSVIASSSYSSPYVAKFNNSTGEVQWVQVGGGTGGWDFEGISIDKDGYIYLDGNGGNGTGVFGTYNVVSQYNCYSDQNVLIAKLDTIAPRAIIPVLAASYCPGSTDTIPYSLLGSFNAGNIFTVELSDSTGNFISYKTLGTDTSNVNGKIVINIPPGTTPGSTYLIRVVSSNPATSSYAACTGDIIANVYNNSFYITIGGNLSSSILASSDTVCSGGTVLLTATGGTTYMWNTGAATDTTTVNPTTDTSYIVTVTNGGCVGNDTVKIAVNPVAPLIIQPPSPASDCIGQPLALSVPASGSDYSWSPSTYLIPDTGSSVVATPAANVTYTVTGKDSLGCSVSSTEIIDVSSGPSKPTITQHDSVLISSSTQSNQWLRNDTVIQGATAQDYVVTISGYYQVTVSNPANGCSTTSDSILASGINQLTVESRQLTVYPNPTGGVIMVNISSSVGEVKDWNLQITDVLGRTVYTKSSLTYSNAVDLSNLSGGVYFISVANKAGRIVVPVVKQ